MRFLVCDSSYHVREGFLTSLLSSGYEVVVIKDKKQILPALMKRPFAVMILDVNEDDLEMIELIKVMHTDPRYEDTKIVVHTQNPSKQFIMDMMQLGIVGYLFKPFNGKEVLNRLKNILGKAGIKMPKMNRINVRPNEEHPVFVSFRSSITHRMVSGLVTDIGVDGISFTLNSEIVDDNKVEVNQIINNFQVDIGSTRISISAMVVFKNNSEVKVIFHKIGDSDINILCKYIYKMLTGLNIER